MESFSYFQMQYGSGEQKEILQWTQKVPFFTLITASE